MTNLKVLLTLDIFNPNRRNTSIKDIAKLANTPSTSIQSFLISLSLPQDLLYPKNTKDGSPLLELPILCSTPPHNPNT